MGKMIAISDNSITVETATKGATAVTVAITAQTKFVKSGVAASVKDLKVGDRVVIHVKENGKKMEATLVYFGKSRETATHH